MHKSLDELISYLDIKIQCSQQRTDSYTNKKEKLLVIKQNYPNIKCENGTFSLDGIQDQITCMSLERKYGRFAGTSVVDIIAKFSLGEKKQNGIKIYSSPVRNVVATIRHPYSNKEIIIRDYESLISKTCPARKRFLKRIKLFLINYVVNNKLSISKDSFDQDGFMRLIMLK
jgi:hypothetical protein